VSGLKTNYKGDRMKFLVLGLIAAMLFLAGCSVRAGGPAPEFPKNSQMSQFENESRQFSIDSSISNDAIIKKDPAICGKIADPSRRHGCYSIIAQETEDYTVCDLDITSTDNRTLRGYCYWEVAAKLNDLTVCDRLDEAGRDGCYMQVATGRKNLSVCDKIPPGDSAFNTASCYRSYAVVYRQPEICDRISDESSRDYCHSRVAEDEALRGNPSACEDIKERDNCYYTVATIRKNQSLCEKIQDSATRETCSSNAA